MKLQETLRRYDLMVAQADEHFQEMATAYPECMACELHCADCCHAVFGLFLVEGVRIREKFDQLDGQVRTDCLMRAHGADEGLRRLEGELRARENDANGSALVLAKSRIRCPLLDDNQECVLYAHRPITCRVYGIPTRIHGKARTCGKARFKQGETYPTFDLDGVYRKLFGLSKTILMTGGGHEGEKASLLLSVSKVIGTPLSDLVAGNFVEPDSTD
jgi:Fe-S-cluster containining protein